MKPDIWIPVTQLMDHAIMDGIFPGAVLLVGTGEQIRLAWAAGVANHCTGQRVSLETVFDLASLTKPLATTLAVMKLVQTGQLSLETRLGDVLPDFRSTSKHGIQLRHLLLHTAGLPAHRHYYRILSSLAFDERKRGLRRMLVEEPLVRPIGSQSEYSDIGFMILCWVVESMARVRLDRYVSREIYDPLGVQDLFFVDLGTAKPEAPFAATERCPWRKSLMVGAVSDDNAWATGGIDGHAGLFGTAGAVYALLKVLLNSFHGRPALPGGPATTVFQPSLVRRFLRRDDHARRTLGFDTPSPHNSSSGKYFSANTVGHLGFTGTSFWMDLDRNITVILLTNRVHPDRDNNRIRAFRPRLHDTVMKTLLFGGRPRDYLGKKD